MTAPDAPGAPDDAGSPRVALALDDEAAARCFPVMAELRTGLASAEEFVERVRRQRRPGEGGGGGYELAFIEEGGRAVCVAGFRVSECLAWGKFLYVDDLATLAAARSRGHGRRMFNWLVALARERGCDTFHLDSGVQRFAAHRFYLNAGLEIRSHHFSMSLSDERH